METPQEFSLFLTRDQIHARVREMAVEIGGHLDPARTIIVGVMGGALFFISDLARGLPGACQLDHIYLSSYHGGTKSSGHVKLEKDASLEYIDHDVLIVDDILDTGRTLDFARSHFMRLGSRCVSIAVLLSKQNQIRNTKPADFVGFDVPDAFYIGYGLDLGNRYRGLEDIYAKSL